MTLTLKRDLDMVKLSHHTKDEVSMSGHSKVIAQMYTDKNCMGQKSRRKNKCFQTDMNGFIVFFVDVSQNEITRFTREGLKNVHAKLFIFSNKCSYRKV